MTATERDSLATTARTLTVDALAGNVAAFKAASAPAIERDFAGVADAVGLLHQSASDGAVTVRSLFILDNPANSANSSGPFVCDQDGVTFNLAGLQPGRYAVAFVHVTGTADPRQISFVFQDISGWKLAGFVQKPLEQGNHDAVWYWRRGREWKAAGKPWSATLAFQMAVQLGSPVTFLSSTNLEKLVAEEQAARPADWPSEDKPLVLVVDGRQVHIQELAPFVAGHDSPDVAVALRFPQLDGTTAAVDGCPSKQVAEALAKKFPELIDFVSRAEVTCKGPQSQSFSDVPLRGGA